MIAEGVERHSVAIAPLVYLVDDDDFREEVVLGLDRLGVNVVGFDGAASFYRAYATRPSDIVILDIGLDGEDGLTIAAHLRASQAVGIIMATARASIDDRVHGLETGADVYLVKPVDLRELAATVVALNARCGRVPSPSSSAAPGWELAEGGWVLVDRAGHRLRLTTSEMRLLGRLFADRGEAVDRDALVEALGENVYDFNNGHLDTIVSRLRRRAKKSDMTLPLHAIRGIGFAFIP